MAMKTPLTAISALVIISLGLVAAGCGGDESTATNAGGAGTTPARQAAADDGSPGPAPCGTPSYSDTPEVQWGKNDPSGVIYISCIDQPITLSADQIDPGDWVNGRPDNINGKVLAPGGVVVSTFGVNGAHTWWPWRLSIAGPDDGKASVRVHQQNRVYPEAQEARFTGDELRTVIVTTSTGQKLRLTAKRNYDYPTLRLPLDNDTTRYVRYSPILIEPA